MAKTRITSYTFDASEKKVTFTGINPVILEGVLLIVNVTDGEIIYNFADPANGGSVATDTVTLEHNTTTMDDTDDLLIYYDDGAAVAISSSVLGNKADNKSAATDTTEVSGISLLKEISYMLQNPTSVAVSASNLDIRDLTSASDSILIYGSDDGGTTKRVIKTDSGGAIQVDLEVASVTVSSGTITANLGATDNGVLDDIAASLAIIDDWDSTDHCNIRHLNTTDDAVNVGTLTTITNAVAVTGTFWQATQPVSIAASVAVTNADLATLAGAVSETHMQVDVLSVPSVTVTATNLDIRDLTSASDSVAAVCTNAGTFAVQAACTGTVTANLSATDNAVLDNIALNQTDASQKSQIVDGSGNVIGATSNALDVNIKSGSTAGEQYADGTTVDAGYKGTIVAGTDGSNYQFLSVTAAGLLNIADGGGAITVDGTVAVTNANLATLAGAVSGTEVQVDVVTMPTTTVTATNLDIRDIDAATDDIAIHGNVGVLNQLDLTNSNPAVVAIVDADGTQITSFGGGTQYTEGDTDATITGTAMMWEDTSDTLRTVSASKPLPVDLGSNNDVTVTSGTITSITNAVAVTGTFWQATQPVSIAASVAVTNADITSCKTALELLDNSVDGNYLNVNCNIAGTDFVGGAGAVAAGVQRVTLASDDPAVTALQLIDDVIYVDDADWTDSTSKHLLVGGLYQSSPQTVTDGDVAPLGIDVNGNLKVVGTVTANLSATDNAVLDTIDAVLDTINAKLVSGTVIGDVNLGATDNAVLDTIDAVLDAINAKLVTGTDIGDVTINNSSGANAVYIQDGGNSITVDGTVALGAGSAAIGKLAANSGVDIGDVDVTSIVPGVGATNLGKAEDAAHSTGDVGVMTLAIRDDTLGVSSGTEGDYEPLHTDALGALWVADRNKVITGIGHGVKTVTTAGTDVALAASTPCKKVVIQAQTDNTNLIAVGGSGVDATIATGSGIVLYPGDSFELEIDNLADIYIDSLVNGEGVRFTYFT